jgi:hypothetical protein
MADNGMMRKPSVPGVHKTIDGYGFWENSIIWSAVSYLSALLTYFILTHPA